MTIRIIYTNTKARVVTADGTLAEFDVTAGVRQGEMLASFLFIVILDYALQIAERNKSCSYATALENMKVPSKGADRS